MNRSNAAQAADPTPSDEGEPGAVDFVRFCYRRRHVGWPELYDEMCAVAGRGLYRGYSADDLNGIGVGLTLFELPALAAIVQRVVAEDQERRRRTVQAIRAAHVDRAGEPVQLPQAEDVEPGDAGTTDLQPRLVPVAAGA